MEGTTTALTAGFTTVASGMTDTIAAIFPVAAPVLGAVLVIKIGIGVFKSVARG